MLTIDREDRPEEVRLVVAGALDMSTGPELEAAILKAEQEGHPRLVLDFSGLDYLDSTGLGLLLDADVRAAAAGREVSVVAGDGEAARVLALANVGERLDVVDLG